MRYVVTGIVLELRHLARYDLLLLLHLCGGCKVRFAIYPIGTHVIRMLLTAVLFDYPTSQ